MTELLTLATGLIALMKSLDMNATVIMTVMFCSLLVLIFNVVALWKLTAPLRELSVSVDHFTKTFNAKMADGEARFIKAEDRLDQVETNIQKIKVHVGL